MKKILVTGAPGSGKSTYVKERHGVNDIIFDYDDLSVTLTGRKRGQRTDEQQHVLNRIRYDILRAAENADVETLWMIATEPNETLIEAMGEYEEVHMDVDKDEAKERVKNDDSRVDKETDYERIDRYFEGRSMKNEREYRAMEYRILESENDEPSYRVEGYASTFERYFLLKMDGEDWYEQIDPHAFDRTDFSDTVFRIDHTGMVYARASAGTVKIDVDNHGLHNVTDLSRTELSRDIWDAIRAGNYPQMSFAFVVGEDRIDYDTKTRVINRVDKVFDISPVTFPQNPGTELHVRNLIDGAIKDAEAERLQREELERRDSERREQLKQKIMEVMEK